MYNIVPLKNRNVLSDDTIIYFASAELISDRNLLCVSCVYIQC